MRVSVFDIALVMLCAAIVSTQIFDRPGAREIRLSERPSSSSGPRVITDAVTVPDLVDFFRDIPAVTSEMVVDLVSWRPGGQQAPSQPDTVPDRPMGLTSRPRNFASAVVSAHGVNLRDGPGADTMVYEQLTRGQRVEIEDSCGVWRKVLLPDGRQGWVSSTYLG